MAANSGDLVRTLIEGGLAPQAARAIANALANAASPTFSQGKDISDATPTEQLRLITSDTRRYQLTNLDFSPSAPFQDRLSANPGEYAGPTPDHPYKDSQPVTSAPPLSSPRVQANDYIAVDNEVDGNAAVSRVGLRLRKDTGRHLRIDPSTKFLDALPFLANTQSAQFLSAEFAEQEEGTELVVSLRNLEKVTLLLANGDSREAFVFPDANALGPDGAAAGGSRSLTTAEVHLEDGRAQQVYVFPKANPQTPAYGPAAARVRAMVVFNANSTQTVGTEVHAQIIKQHNISKVVRVVTGAFDVYFASPMPVADYGVLMLAADNPSGQVAQKLTFCSFDTEVLNTSGFRVRFWTPTTTSISTPINPLRATVAVLA